MWTTCPYAQSGVHVNLPHVCRHLCTCSHPVHFDFFFFFTLVHVHVLSDLYIQDRIASIKCSLIFIYIGHAGAFVLLWIWIKRRGVLIVPRIYSFKDVKYPFILFWLQSHRHVFSKTWAIRHNSSHWRVLWCGRDDIQIFPGGTEKKKSQSKCVAHFTQQRWTGMNVGRLWVEIWQISIPLGFLYFASYC